MRISDWSSDVCSSDLADGLRIHFTEQCRELAGFEVDRCGIGPHAEHTENIIRIRHAVAVEDFAAIDAVHPLAKPRRHGEIGRASCRERGGQYVEILVVAVSLIKKKQTVKTKTP